jgi:RimJ/RimL family protein N-acetyltransferase
MDTNGVINTIVLNQLKRKIQSRIDQMLVNRVWGSCDAGNASSEAVMRRAGMRDEGLLRAETRDHHGQLRDTRVFALTIDDYPGWSAAHGITDRVYLAEPR